MNPGFEQKAVIFNQPQMDIRIQSKDAAGRVSGNGFYYLMGDIARLHEAVLAYGRDFMIDKGFTYCCLLYTSVSGR